MKPEDIEALIRAAEVNRQSRKTVEEQLNTFLFWLAKQLTDLGGQVVTLPRHYRLKAWSSGEFELSNEHMVAPILTGHKPSLSMERLIGDIDTGWLDDIRQELERNSLESKRVATALATAMA